MNEKDYMYPEDEVFNDKDVEWVGSIPTHESALFNATEDELNNAYKEHIEKYEYGMVRPYDNVKQPSHYKIFPDTEVIDIIRKVLTREEFIGYCKGNILKYRLRDKENISEDFLKSKEYKNYLQDVKGS